MRSAATRSSPRGVASKWGIRSSWPFAAFAALLTACGGTPRRDAHPDLAGAGGSVASAAGGICPVDMVSIARQFCIDRYEASMIDEVTGQDLSPYYPPDREELRGAVIGQSWGPAALGRGQLVPPVPRIPDWEWSDWFVTRATSRAAVVPQGYLSERTARVACERAGKRLCKPAEWLLACRGQDATRFPYGPKYREGVCNVHVPHHPAAILYGDASIGHWDPRLNQVAVAGRTLLAPTGAYPECKSVWGDDAVYDMVGNLDEWVDDANGEFVGGFYSRETTRGCDAKVIEHGPAFFDYSTGVRCCAAAQSP